MSLIFEKKLSGFIQKGNYFTVFALGEGYAMLLTARAVQGIGSGEKIL